MYRSFLVRVWRDEDMAGDAGWQAEVQHIQSGQSWHFNSSDDLLAFLGQLTNDPGGASQHREQILGS